MTSKNPTFNPFPHLLLIPYQLRITPVRRLLCILTTTAHCHTCKTIKELLVTC